MSPSASGGGGRVLIIVQNRSRMTTDPRMLIYNAGRRSTSGFHDRTRHRLTAEWKIFMRLVAGEGGGLVKIYIQRGIRIEGEGCTISIVMHGQSRVCVLTS